MTRARYKTEVKLFALNERKEDKSWSFVRRAIKEKFHVEPPSVRAMEKWQKSINPENITAELMKDVKKEIGRVKEATEIEIGQNMLPMISKARESGENMEAAAWNWFFNWAENYIGREKFIRLVTNYLEQTKKNKGASGEEAEK